MVKGNEVKVLSLARYSSIVQGTQFETNKQTCNMSVFFSFINRQCVPKVFGLQVRTSGSCVRVDSLRFNFLKTLSSPALESKNLSFSSSVSVSFSLLNVTSMQYELTQRLLFRWYYRRGWATRNRRLMPRPKRGQQPQPQRPFFRESSSARFRQILFMRMTWWGCFGACTCWQADKAKL